MKNLNSLLVFAIALNCLLITSSAIAKPSTKPRNLFVIQGKEVLIWNGLEEEFFDTEGQLIFRNLATEAPRYLIRMGLDNLGGLDLRTLVSEAHQVTFSLVTRGHTLAQGRSGNMYDVVKKLVRINKGDFEFATKLNGMSANNVGRLSQWTLLLHETLGALGYKDDNYEISGAIVGAAASTLKRSYPSVTSPTSLSSEKILQAFTEIHFDLGRRIDNPTDTRDAVLFSEFEKLQFADAGGSSEGGGGGDPAAALAKAMTLEKLLRDGAPISQLKFLLFNTQIETFEGCGSLRASRTSNGLLVYLGRDCLHEFNIWLKLDGNPATRITKLIQSQDKK